MGEETNKAANVPQLWRQWSRITELLFGSVEAVTDYKSVVLGLVFLKYISDCCDERQARLVHRRSRDAASEGLGDREAGQMFLIPPEARWEHLIAHSKRRDIGRLVDDAIVAIESQNWPLLDVFPREQISEALRGSRSDRLLEMINAISTSDEEVRSREYIGQVFEYVLSLSARAEGVRARHTYTPRCVVNLLTTMIEPGHGLVYDPCCGSAGMLVGAAEFADMQGMHDGPGGKARADISFYGQESNRSIWQLAKMNLAVHALEGEIICGDALRGDLHPGLEADYILANPPLDVSGWGRDQLKGDRRWKYGVPPAYNANFAWLQHALHHLAPSGVAAIVLADKSLSSRQASERIIRKALIEADVIDCIVALPARLFYSTPVSTCIWILRRDGGDDQFRSRRGETLFIDGRDLGHRIGRQHWELTDQEIQDIGDTYHSWRSRKKSDAFKDIPGFCRTVPVEEVRSHEFILTPDPYVARAND